MFLLLPLVVAADPLHDCAEATIARASPAVQATIRGWGQTVRSLEEREAGLEAGGFDAAARLVQAAVRQNDPDRARRVAARLAAEVSALPADDDVHRYRGELALAIVSVALGDRDAAGKHLRAARAIPDIPTTQQLLVAMALVGEPRDAVEKVWLAEAGDSVDVLDTLISLSRALGYAGAGRAVLAADYAGRARKLPLGDVESSQRAHDEVLQAALEGASAVEDWTLVADLMTDPAMRANAEAQAARGLVMVDRDAGLALAHTAKARADATPPTSDNQFDLNSARSAIASTEARAGGVAGAGVSVYDVAFGLVTAPDRRVAWWTSLSNDDRARVAAGMDNGGWPETRTDRAVWAELCAGR